MKVLACHIENFGKLSDLAMDFTEGMNVVDGPNGWGKSTLAAFMKAMFYGLDPRKAPGAYDKERKMYAPWQGGVFGGQLDFDINGKRYRVIRTFGDSEKSDSFHLYDLSTNLESTDYSKNLGTEIFDLDNSSFRRSIFIAQNDVVSVSTDGINAKLTNLVENTNDINNYETANRQLHNLLNYLSPTRATGTVKRREAQIAAMEQELSGYARAEKAYEMLADKQHEQVIRFEELSGQRKLFTVELQKTSKENVRLEKKQQYELLQEELADSEEKCREFAAQFPGGLPTESELETFARTNEQIREMDVAIRNMSEEEGGDRNFEKLAAEFSSGLPKEEEIYAQIGRHKVLANAREELKGLENQLGVLQKVQVSRRENYRQEQERKQTMEANRKQELRRRANRRIGVADLVFWILGTLLLASSVLFPSLAFLPESVRSNSTVAMVLAALGGMFLMIAVVGLCLLAAGIRKKNKLRQPPKMEETPEPPREESRALWENQEEISGLEQSIEEKYNEVTDMERHIELFLKKFHLTSDSDNYVDSLYGLANDRRDYVRIAHRRKLLQSAEETKQELEHLLDELADAYELAPGETGEIEFENIRVRAAEYRLVQAEYDRLRQRLDHFEAENDIEQLMQERRHIYTLEELNDAIRKLDEQMEEVREAISEYNKEMDLLQEQLNQQEEKLEEYQKLVKKQEEEAHKYEIADYTQKFLLKAKESFTSRYLAPVEEGFAKYYEFICGSQTKEWQLDSNMEYSVMEYGKMRSVPQLSVGFQDLIGVCMRLALVSAMYQKEKPFLVLDDPFVNLDQEKMESAKRLLMQMAEEYQVMYFTCHQMREP